MSQHNRHPSPTPESVVDEEIDSLVDDILIYCKWSSRAGLLCAAIEFALWVLL